jgi:peroxiredoxin Q/BCP
MAKSVVLKAGDKAPAFALKDQSGATVKLSSYKGRKVLIFFYPKADTPGCTAQACGLRDVAGEVGDTAILGISPDLPEKQKKFDTKYSLGFPLLSDADHAVAEAYGVWGEKKNYGRTYMGITRATVLIDRHGVVARSWAKVKVDDHAEMVLEAARELAGH